MNMSEHEDETNPLLSHTNSTSTSYISCGNRTGTNYSDKFRRYASSSCILLTVSLERIAFYSLAGNLFLFLYQKPFEWLYYNAMNALYVLTGVTYISSFFGGWLADSFLGRFWTIVIALVLYTASYGVLTKLAYSNNTTGISNVCVVTSYPNPSDQEPCTWLIYLILVIIGIATGTVKANIAPFGADQVRAAGPDSLRVFFNWFYWCINIGSFVAIGAIAYVQQSYLGFFIGYLIPACFLGVAIIIFIFGKPLYITQNPSGSAIMAVFAIFKEAWKSNRRRTSRINNSEVVNSNRSLGSPPSWLDMAKVQYGGKFHEAVVEDVKTLGRVMVVFVALIPYWLLYFQMQTTFLVQGIHMKLSPNFQHSCNSSDSKKEEEEFSVPAAWLTLFDIVFLLIFIPLMDRVIYPCLDRRGKKIPLLCRISLGMFCAVISMTGAGILEGVRLDLVRENRTICQVIGNNTYVAADMWIFWQIPQYALIGLSEVFASVAGLEYACSQAPRTMQGIIMGLFCFCTGIGSFLGTGLLFVVKDYWFSNGDVNKGHLDRYFFLLAGIQAATFIIFTVFKNKIEVKRPTMVIPPQESLRLDRDT
ncbi:solute carrier family 15 member 4-like [Centruroides vittatus]|uniref:solute carrier family 15 member 4-like n=1 Tax=Centruroides vittatus TaxID=120091 RepID=UPI00350FC291